MAFHRLTVPGYAGGLRGGDDYINNVLAGTPAPADSALGAGPYIGSYFFAPTDQVTGAAINRGFKALATNTDFLDNAIVQTNLDVAGVAADLAASDAAFAAFVAALQASATGDALVGAAAKSGTFFTLAAGTVRSQLTTLASHANALEAATYGKRTVVGTASMNSDDGTLFLDTVTGGVPYNIALPDPADAGVAGHRYFFAAKDGANIETNTVTLVRFGTEKIDGLAANYVLDVAGGRWILESDGTDWYIWSC